MDDDDCTFRKLAANPRPTTGGIGLGVKRGQFDLICIERWISREDAIHGKTSRDGCGDIMGWYAGAPQNRRT
jgi:hypothetical protein